MFKTASKLAGLLLLLVLSFIYTDSVFDSARKSDPVMKEIINFKKENDVLPTEPIINGDEITIGYTGLLVNENESYKKMKDIDKFDKDKIVYSKSLPNDTISKNYDYYIKQGNPTKKEVSLIFKIAKFDDVSSLLKLIAKQNIKVTFFVDGAWLEQNVEEAFSMINLGCDMYNLGYNGKYQKGLISTTNNLIESISLRDSNFCLNDNKNDSEKEICKSKKMHTIVSTLSNPSFMDLKNNLTKGAIISYDLNTFDLNTLPLVIKTITGKGYQIKGLSSVVKE